MVLEPLDPFETLGLRPEQLPRHIAIIMDGNGRWARRQGQPRIVGHQHGAQAVDEVTTAAARLGIGQLTLYAFSTENWQRSRDETDFLMQLYARFLRSHREKIIDNNIRFRQIGRRDRLPRSVLDSVQDVEEQSRRNTGMVLCLAVDYGGRQEILEAVRRLCQQAAAGQLDPAQIDQQRFSAALYTAGMTDPDLLIRTAGEMRISNFLLWQISYAELYVTELLWPDFRPEHLYQAIQSYASRERRFGRVPTDTT